jgi:hypothetical protein
MAINKINGTRQLEPQFLAIVVRLLYLRKKGLGGLLLGNFFKVLEINDIKYLEKVTSSS